MRRATSKDVHVPGATLEQKINRAKGYPYSRPDTSFIFARGKSHSLSNDLWKGPLKLREMLSIIAPESSWDLKDYENVEWHAVLAIGSNASPEQLARKYPNNDVIVPVVQCALQDFDVVYAPLVSSYGSCTATLAHAPGTVVEVYVTYLTSALLDRMIETEGAYDLVKLQNIDLKLSLSLMQYQDGKEPVNCLDSVLQFNHQEGTLNFPLHPSQDGPATPVSLKAIPAQRRRFPELQQIEMLSKIMQYVRPSRDIDLDTWIQLNLENEDVRQSLVEQLLSMSHPFTYPDTEVMIRIGHVHSKNVQ